MSADDNNALNFLKGQGLRGVMVYDCKACDGTGRLRRNRGKCPDCDGRRVMIIQGGSVVRLTAEPPAKAQTQYLQRIADSQCTVCGSTQLESDTLCYECLAQTNDRARNIKRSQRTGEIG